MKVTKVTELEEKFTQYDISTSTENFYVKAGNRYILIHNSPAIIFGRDEQGFVFTDKSGFGAKGYDGKARSPDALEAMFYARGGGSEKSDSYKAFIAQMKAVFPIYEQAVPQDFLGFYKGDLLYFNTPPELGGVYSFTPQIVQYDVKADSPLGQKVGRSESGIVIHSMADLEGNERPLDSSDKFVGDSLLVFPSVTAIAPPIVDTHNTQNLRTFINNHSTGLDSMLNADTLRELKISNLADLFYRYVNSKVDTTLEGLGNDFQPWIEGLNPKVVSDKKKANIINYLIDHEEAFHAMWKIISSIMRMKDDIITQFEGQGAEVTASINGEAGGEGYVYAHKDGDIKLVPREFFSRANRAVVRT